MRSRRIRKWLAGLIIPVLSLGMLAVTADRAFAADDDYKVISKVELSFDKMRCGTPVKVTEKETTYGTGQTIMAAFQTPEVPVKVLTEGAMLIWDSDWSWPSAKPAFTVNDECLSADYYYTKDILFAGKLIPDSCWVRILLAPDYDKNYIFPEREHDIQPLSADGATADGEGFTVTVNGKKAQVASSFSEGAFVFFKVDESMIEHDWDEGKVTRKPTVKEEGIMTYTCKGCGKIRTEPIPKLKPEKAAKAKPFATLVVTSSGRRALNFKVGTVAGASGYELYMSKCDQYHQKYKPKKVKTVESSKGFTWKKSGLKKNTAYKAYVKAYTMKNGKKKYLATSPVAHAYTNAAKGQFTNAKEITADKSKVSLKKGKSATVKATAVKLNAGGRMPNIKHAPKIRYRSNNKAVATVSASGRITGKSAGKCVVYAFGVNGVFKKIPVTVK